MSELRLDPTSREWVIIAGERGDRPHEYASSRHTKSVPPYVGDCPFCPGNEELAPPAVLEMRDASTQGWRVRAFPNKYPALSLDSVQSSDPGSSLFTSRPGLGFHEVLVETPRHNGFPAVRSQEEMLLVLQAYQQRYSALMEGSDVEYVLVFKNQGEAAGTSLVHPHSQVIAASLVPERERRKAEIAREHYNREGKCLHCHLVAKEIEDGRRVVYRDENFVVFHPFAAGHAAETWILPLWHGASFGQVDGDGMARFASVLCRTLRQLSAGFDDPDFNYAIHSAPRGEEEQPWSHWYLQLIPRLSKAAGFELGSGMYINPMPPERTAEIMRLAIP